MWRFFKKNITTFFIKNNFIHLNARPVQYKEHFVQLADRFVCGNMNYDMEWDDFISWEHDNPEIENIRKNLSEHEKLLFSKKKQDRDKYIELIVRERNKFAIECGMDIKELYPKSTSQIPVT